MGYENSAGLNVNNHYGERVIGGTEGQLPSAGAEREVVINFDGNSLGKKTVVPVGAVVTEIVDSFTGTISAATVGATDISGADGAVANYVTIGTAGDLTVTGPTAGSAIVKYTYVA